MLNLKFITISLYILVLACGAACADDFKWPDTLEVAGFQISSVSGTVDSSGAGSATGQLSLPGAGTQTVSLERTSSGKITGELSLSTNWAQGSFSLTDSGMKGSGSVPAGNATVENADITITPSGKASGSGKVSIGGNSVDCRFTSSSSSLTLSGAFSSTATSDTPLASYEFNGRVEVTSQGREAATTASGQVKRTGKLAEKVTNHNVSGIAVDISSGKGTANIGGVTVEFDFF